MTLGCNGLTNKNDSLKNSEIQFEKNWKAFEKHHVGGVINKDINLFLELYSDSVKWSPPNWNNNQIFHTPPKWRVFLFNSFSIS